tara:strand:+ start:810 stop:1256 length:447 start_codon:yes stop_codon:yes gene_type:complete
MTQSIIQPKKPNNPAWKAFSVDLNIGFCAVGYHHQRLNLNVISAVEAVEADIGPEYHLSISRCSGSGLPRRCSAEEARMVLKQFDAEHATEDNHSSIIRNYWLPVNQALVGIECDCKDSEAAVTEGDFEWRPLTKENAERAKLLEQLN